MLRSLRSLRRYSSINRPSPGARSSSAPPPPPPSRGSSLSRAQWLGVEVAVVFGAATLGFILSSTLREHDLPLVRSLTSLHLPLAAGSFAPFNDDPDAKGAGTYQPQHGSLRAYKAAIESLQAHFAKIGRSDDVSTDDSDLEDHGISQWSYHGAHKPSVVVWAQS